MPAFVACICSCLLRLLPSQGWVARWRSAWHVFSNKLPLPPLLFPALPPHTLPPSGVCLFTHGFSPATTYMSWRGISLLFLASYQACLPMSLLLPSLSMVSDDPFPLITHLPSFFIFFPFFFHFARFPAALLSALSLLPSQVVSHLFLHRFFHALPKPDTCTWLQADGGVMDSVSFSDGDFALSAASSFSPHTLPTTHTPHTHHTRVSPACISGGRRRKEKASA